MTVPVKLEKDTCPSNEALVLHLLNSIAKLSYTLDEPQQAIDLFEEAKATIPLEYDFLVDAVETHLFWARSCKFRVSEKTIRDEFFAHLYKYLPGAAKAKVKVNNLHMPDGFVLYEGEVLPVEVKKVAIVGSSIKQIQRYMREYGSAKGIVVAPKLLAPLPSNVIFVKVPDGSSHVNMKTVVYQKGVDFIRKRLQSKDKR
jgi:hypothetical protein